MAAQQRIVGLPPNLDLCPSPLYIRKKPRRATIYQRLLPKPSHQHYYESITYGPLDDIISEISGDIWRSPSGTTCEPGFGSWDWRNPLKAPSTCIVMPLPISRIPSDQPLIVRKNKNSRSAASAASGSSSGRTMASSSRDYSRPKPASTNNAFVSTDDDSNTPWPPFEEPSDADASEHRSVSGTIYTEHSPAQESLLDIKLSKRRGSRMHGFLTKGLSRLRRTSTGESTKSNASSSLDPAASHIELGETDKFAYSADDIKSRIVADRLSSPTDHRREQIDSVQARENDPESISTLKAAIRITSEDHKLKEEEVQDFWVCVEVLGLLHNRQELRDPMLDVAFIIDNGYYVSEECIQRALNAVTDALRFLDRGDRVALYTTHCTHYGAVTGTTPDVIYPLRPVSSDTEEMLQDITKEIANGGHQSWQPPRPNPSMADVVLAVAKSLEGTGSKEGHTHLIVLSPTTNVLHKVSVIFPQLYMHQINPAVLPYRHNEQLQDKVCRMPCCQNVFVHNWSHYQNLSSSIKQILRYARCEKPLGSIENMHIDIKTKKGCEVLQYDGATDIDYLRLGQTHSFFVQIRVKPLDTDEIDLNSSDPFLNVSLDATYMRQNLRNVKADGGSMAHLLSVQLAHQSSLHAYETWCFTEAQLLVLKNLGRMMTPTPTFMDLQKRQLFYRFRRLDNKTAKEEIEKLAVSLVVSTDLKRLIDRMAGEIHRQESILEYEQRERQKLPSCLGPVVVASQPHEWLVAVWNEKRSKRRGMS